MSTSRHDRTETHDRPALAGAPIRRQLLDSTIALVEDVCSTGAVGANGTTAGFSPDFQVAFPYRGVLVWHVGRDDVVGDANQALFVSGGEPFQVSEPQPGGYGELIITPKPGVLAEIAQSTGSRLRANPLFRRRSRRADPRLQSQRTRSLHWAAGTSHLDALAAEEMLLGLLRAALVVDPPRDTAADSSLRLIRQTKEFLEAEFANPIQLHQVGRAVGASPAYLTDLFRRVEGVSLHRYVVQLRLARALVELPQAENLAALALEVGFSSHSHSSAAFRRAFGCTPSEFRQTTSTRQRPSSS